MSSHDFLKEYNRRMEIKVRVTEVRAKEVRKAHPL
jgi:hypothetical protein